MKKKDIKLTERKKEILKLIAEGKTNREIANELIVTTNTVKAHLVGLFKQLGVTSRCELITWGFRNGILK